MVTDYTGYNIDNLQTFSFFIKYCGFLGFQESNPSMKGPDKKFEITGSEFYPRSQTDSH